MVHKVSYNSDNDLLKGFKSGEKVAYDQIALCARKAVYSKIPDIQPDDANDIIQQTLTGLWLYTSQPDFRLEQSVIALTVRIAMARCIDFFRQKRYFQELSEKIPCKGETAEEKAICEEKIRNIFNALNKIKPLCKNLIKMRYIKEMSYNEIAELQKRNASTLRVQLHNCLKSLRSYLKMCDT